jgi:hypothetical protein
VLGRDLDLNQQFGTPGLRRRRRSMHHRFESVPQ